jgi:hypothetical protein
MCVASTCVTLLLLASKAGSLQKANSLLAYSAPYDALGCFALYMLQTASCPPKSGQECAIWVADSWGLIGYN